MISCFFDIDGTLVNNLKYFEIRIRLGVRNKGTSCSVTTGETFFVKVDNLDLDFAVTY